MLSETVGPWRRADYDSFIDLDITVKPAQSTPVTLGGLLELPSTADRSASEAQEARQIEKAWAVRKSHPIYLWLDSNPLFGELWRLFEKRRSQAISEDKIASSDAPFLMLKIVVEWTGILFDIAAFERRAGVEKSTTGATKPRRRSAVRKADALINLLNQGVSMQGIENRQLMRLLVRFREEINSIDRKPREGKGSTTRRMLEFAAFQMVAKLGLSSPSILENLAAMVGTRCDNKTAQRIFRRAEKNIATYWHKVCVNNPDR